MFRAPFIPKERVWEIVEDFRSKHSRAQNIPTDILDLAEFDLGLELIPISGLKENLDMEALLLGDQSGIWIDQRVFEDERYQNRLRFSVAHEVGHSVLHGDLYKQAQVNYSNKEGWIEFFKTIPEREYSFIESQAYEFAGRLLVPIDELQSEYEKLLLNLKETNVIDLDKIDNAMIIDYIARPISRHFGVSSEVISRRFQKEGF